MKISFIGKTPSENEYAQLTSVPYAKKPLSASERNSKIKKAFMMVGFSIFCLIFGLIAFMVGRSGSGSAGSGTISIMGIIVLIGCPGFLLAALGFLISMSKDPRSKDSSGALYKYVKRVLIGDDSDKFEKKSIDYAYSVLQRMLPESRMVDYKTFEIYLKDLRLKIKNDVKDNDTGVFTYGGETIHTSKIISPGIEKRVTKLEFNYSFNNKVASKIEMTFDITLIQPGGYWFIYDPMPEYKI